jgi:uncharacterized spore protein YtfJ
MSVPEILKSVGDALQSSATVRNVYGEPVSKGDRTVIPVARISYGFGGGGGVRKNDKAPESGGGGGGKMSAMPAGVIEITPAGTQFIPFLDWRRWVSVAAISLAVGIMIGARRKDS